MLIFVVQKWAIKIQALQVAWLLVTGQPARLLAIAALLKRCCWNVMWRRWRLERHLAILGRHRQLMMLEVRRFHGNSPRDDRSGSTTRSPEVSGVRGAQHTTSSIVWNWNAWCSTLHSVWSLFFICVCVFLWMVPKCKTFLTSPSLEVSTNKDTAAIFTQKKRGFNYRASRCCSLCMSLVKWLISEQGGVGNLDFEPVRASISCPRKLWEKGGKCDEWPGCSWSRCRYGLKRSDQHWFSIIVLL